MVPRTFILISFVLLAPLAACDESTYARYATYAEAEQAGAVQRGWIPPYVPANAVDIAEAHDLDLNTQRLRFRMPVADVPRLTAGMERLPLSQGWPPTVRSPELPGNWPSELSNYRITPRASLHLYRAPAINSGARCLAIEMDRGMVYAWSCDERAS